MLATDPHRSDSRTRVRTAPRCSAPTRPSRGSNSGLAASAARSPAPPVNDVELGPIGTLYAWTFLHVPRMGKVSFGDTGG